MVEERGSFCGNCEDWGSFWGSLWGSNEDRGSIYGGKGIMGGLMLRVWLQWIIVKKDWDYQVDLMEGEDDFFFIMCLFGCLFMVCES